MKAEIIAIGTELLLGDIVNSNASYLSKKLAELGIDVYHHSTVGDNPGRLSSAIKLGLLRSDIVITTGGLGPTVDDVTVSTISKTVGRKLILDITTAKRIKERFRRRHIKLPVNNLRQAYIPQGAVALKNNEGTAPGLFIRLTAEKYLIALPGPPRELAPMFEKEIAGLLKKISGAEYVIKSRFIKITGLPESKVCEKVKDLLKLKPPVTVGIYAKLGEVDLKIMAKAQSQTHAMKAIKPVEKTIHKRLGGYIFGVDNQILEGTVGKILLKNRKTLSIAESCTGGLISSRITDVPGSSKYFKMGLVAYSNQTKEKLLGVPDELLTRYGAVSKEVAIKMARSIRELGGADIGLSTTGIAGPTGATSATRRGGSAKNFGGKTKPVGLVYIALCTGKKTICKKFFFLGDRASIKWQASQAALNLLRVGT
jgi:nicotinamide-nucleotide amidase